MNITELDSRGMHEMRSAGGGGATHAHAVTRYDVDEGAASRGSGIRGLMAFAFAMGGVVRDAVYITADALRGRYDHF